LSVPGEHGIGAKVGGGFHGLVLQDGGAQSEQRVVVLQREAERVIE